MLLSSYNILEHILHCLSVFRNIEIVRLRNQFRILGLGDRLAHISNIQFAVFLANCICHSHTKCKASSEKTGNSPSKKSIAYLETPDHRSPWMQQLGHRIDPKENLPDDHTMRARIAS